MICYGKYQVQNKFKVLGYYEKNDVEFKKILRQAFLLFGLHFQADCLRGKLWVPRSAEGRRLTLCWPCFVGKQLRTHNASKPGVIGRRQVPIPLAMDSTCHCRHLGSGIRCDADPEADLHAICWGLTLRSSPPHSSMDHRKLCDYSEFVFEDFSQMAGCFHLVDTVTDCSNSPDSVPLLVSMLFDMWPCRALPLWLWPRDLPWPAGYLLAEGTQTKAWKSTGLPRHSSAIVKTCLGKVCWRLNDVWSCQRTLPSQPRSS